MEDRDLCEDFDMIFSCNPLHGLCRNYFYFNFLTFFLFSLNNLSSLPNFSNFHHSSIIFYSIILISLFHHSFLNIFIIIYHRI